MPAPSALTFGESLLLSLENVPKVGPTVNTHRLSRTVVPSVIAWDLWCVEDGSRLIGNVKLSFRVFLFPASTIYSRDDDKLGVLLTEVVQSLGNSNVCFQSSRIKPQMALRVHAEANELIRSAAPGLLFTGPS